MRIMVSLLIGGLLSIVGCSNQNTESTAANTTNGDLTTNADLNLKQIVKAKLATDPQLANVEVKADAQANQVTLSGAVPSEQAHNEAIDMANASRSDVKVVDQMELKPEVASQNIEPSRGETTASAARSEYTKEMAEKAQQQAKALGNKIGRSLDEAWLYTKIETKLVGHTAAPALKINVDVEGKVVTLRGQVPTAEMKREAERIAKETEGVTVVRNLLQVKA